VVDAALRAALAEDLRRRGGGREPTAAEVDAAIERWIDQEILVREATARGLDRDDPIVRERIAAKMAFVLEQQVTVPEPSEAELRRFFEAHRERWVSPARVDFTHVFVDGTDAAAAARADALRARLEAGAAPETLGDRFSGGHRYRGRKLADLEQSFGAGFVAGLDAQPAGAWVARRSRFGLHLVRVDRHEPGRAADFDTARPDVRKAWMEERRAAGLGEAIRGLRQRWEILHP
jgi:parvulin-like peptidyl-prolyl isomerase